MREPAAVRRIKQLRDLDRPLPAERIRVARAAYFGMCEYFDSLVGRILQKLEDTGLERETLVIYCSDHGEMAGKHGLWSKSTYYEEAAGVPLIARLPGVVPEGIENSTICNLMDLGPTLADMAGGGSMSAVDGQSLWPMMCGREVVGRTNETYCELAIPGADNVPSRMVRRGPWKLCKYHDLTPPVLYNLEEDPEELNDLGSDPGYEEVRAELLVRLFEEWDPGFVLKESAALDRDMQLITRWGAAVQPPHEDTLPVPDVEDVVLR